MLARLSYEFVKSKFEERGYILLEDTYKNNNTKMRYICSLHPDKELSITFSKFHNAGQGCPYCGGSMPLTTDEVRRNIENEGYKLLSEYKNSKTKIKLICPEGHAWDCVYWNFKKGHRCYQCSRNVYCIEDINKMFIERNYLLITNHYENFYQKMTYVCKLHECFGEQKISFANFIKGHGCRICANEILSEKNKKYNINMAREIFDENNKILIEKEFIDCTKKMKYVCKSHPESIQEMTLTSAIRGRLCPDCVIEVISGENNYNWKGGITSLYIYMRQKTSQWRLDSLKHFNYKCAITGVNNSKLVVHHLYNFASILEESLSELKFTNKRQIGDFSSEELIELENILIKKHYDYGLGVPLIPEIHRKFHSIYGNKKNTVEQFEEFKNNYINNKIEGGVLIG